MVMTQAERTKRWRGKNREHVNEVGRKNARDGHARIKLEVFTAYGGKCVCCGEDDLHFLTIDHVAQAVPDRHRQADGRRVSGTKMLYLLREEGYPDDCRILCWNCNCARGYYGFCPHQPHDESERRYPSAAATQPFGV